MNEQRYDSAKDTLLHIKRVNALLLQFLQELINRAVTHDESKLHEPEKMFFEWKAASERHNDGDVLKSIEINKQRFGLSEQLCKIFENTERWLCIKNTINQKE